MDGNAATPPTAEAGAVSAPEVVAAGTGPVRLTELVAYADDRGNRITYNGTLAKRIRIKFTGSNNTLVVDDAAAVLDSVFDFDCDNGLLRIGTTRKGGTPLRAHIRVGQDGQVLIGDNVSATTPCAMSAAEGAVITIGDDVMFASANAVRADDGHPIFDVRTGKRLNTSRPITIGNHVWLGKDAAVLGGVTIGDGSVIGYASVVTKNIPNNCIAAGVPAKVVRRDIAWERPHLTLTKPYYKNDSSTISRSPYWHLTADAGETPKAAPRLNATNVRRGLRRRAGRLKARLTTGRKG